MGFFAGKTIIITGGGKAAPLKDGSAGSIGYGIAIAFAKEGANLVLTGRNEQKLIDAEEGPYGLWVTAIFGEKADDSKNQYWMFYKDGAELPTGISDTYIADGEHYEARIVQY